MTAQEYNDKRKDYTTTKQRAMLYEDKIKFLSVPDVERVPMDSDYYFNQWSERINNDASFNRLKSNYTNPNAATSLLTEIWVENTKVWHANDQTSMIVEKNASDTKIDFDILDWWMLEGWELYQNSPNSVGVAFVRQDRTIGIIGVEFQHIDFIHTNDNGDISELGYKAKNKLYYFAENEYTIYDLDKDGKIIATNEQVPYWQGLPPVFAISSRVISSSNPTKTNILRDIYPAIGDYLYNTLLSKMNTSFAYANIIERVRNADGCHWEHKGLRCEGGYMVSVDGGENITSQRGSDIPCPKCNSAINIGGVVEIPIRALMDSKEPTSAIKFITPDVSALKFTSEDMTQTRVRLFASGTGKGKNQSAESNNNFNSELSIIYAGESQRDQLREIKKDLERNVERSASIVGSLMLGNNLDFVRISLGDNFLLYSREQLIALKTQADALGLSDVMQLDEQIIEASANGDENLKRRSKVILMLNNIIGIDNTKVALATYELENGSIIGSNKTVKQIVTQIIKEHGTKTTENVSVQDGQQTEPIK